MVKALQLVFYLVLYVHMKACIWFFICRSYKKWLPPVFWDYPVDGSYMQDTFFNGENYVQQYILSLYYSVLMLKPNELGPKSNIETIVCSIMLIIDLIVAANIYGSMAVLVQMAGRRSQKFQKQIDNANTAMKDMKISKNVQHDVRAFLVLI